MTTAKHSAWIDLPVKSYLSLENADGSIDYTKMVKRYRISTIIEPKREFVVGKWYKPVASAPYDTKWVRCVGVDGEMGWLTQSNVHPAIRRNTSYVDWSVTPKDELP